MSPEKTKKLKLELFKSSIISAAFSLFSQRKKEARSRGEKYLLQDMAERAGVDKSQASRWFGGGDPPNMQLSTLFAIGDALDGDVRIEIVDRKTGEVHTAHGIETPTTQVASVGMGQLFIVQAPSHPMPKHPHMVSGGSIIAVTYHAEPMPRRSVAHGSALATR